MKVSELLGLTTQAGDLRITLVSWNGAKEVVYSSATKAYTDLEKQPLHVHYIKVVDGGLVIKAAENFNVSISSEG